MPGGRTGAFGRSIDGLQILSCLSDMSSGNNRSLRIPRSADTIARLTGLSRATVCDQLVRLRRYGYVEEAADEHYRLPIEGRLSEIAVTATRGLPRRRRDKDQGDDTASASA
jgi:DNA-binding IclR family transcriptional regulator